MELQKLRSVAILAAFALLSAARPAAPLLSGAYRSDCAPYDGAAFLITLQAPAQLGEFWLRANVPLAEVAGHWHHSMEARPGSASIVLCRKAPDQNCDYPEAGSFIVTGKPGAQITGAFNAHFVGGMRYAYRFTATLARNERMTRCG